MSDNSSSSYNLVIFVVLLVVDVDVDVDVDSYRWIFLPDGYTMKNTSVNAKQSLTA